MPDQRRLLFFLVKVFVLILIFAALWRFVAPGYTRLLTAASNGVAPSNINMEAVDSSIIMHVEDQWIFASIHTLPLQAGLLLVIAFVIATPGLKMRRRLECVVAAVLVTFGLHVASVLIMSSHAQAMRPLVVLFASVGIDLFPVLVWAVLSAKYWWPSRTLREQE